VSPRRGRRGREVQASSGLDLTRRLRTDARTKNTGIIVLTGYDVASVRRQADEAGCDRFVVKPCAPETLALEIRDVLISRHCHSPETSLR
jgi:CheY-like chemotaxis protein